MTYEFVTRLAFVATLALCLTLLFVPGLIFWLFHITDDPSALVLARRAAMLFLGLSAISFMAMDAAEAETRKAISVGFLVTMTGLAVLGLVELVRGTVGIGIWLAIFVEIFFAYHFLMFWRDEA